MVYGDISIKCSIRTLGAIYYRKNRGFQHDRNLGNLSSEGLESYQQHRP